jgi:nitrogen fixation protein FixH
MTRLMKGGLVVFAMLAPVACSRQESTTQSQATSTANMPAPAATAPAGAAELTFKSDPETPKMGENAFEVMVMQDGKPVDDAQVSVEFHMAAMPQMNMAEMRNKADLKPAGNGMYRGTGHVMMAGNWDVTVMAMRDGQEIGTRNS